MNFSVATISSFNAMPGSALKLIGATVSIDGPIGPTIAGLLAAHFVWHVGAIWISIASPFVGQTGAVAASVLRCRTCPRQQNRTVPFVGSSIAIRITITHPNLRNAIAVVWASKRAGRAIPASFYTRNIKTTHYNTELLFPVESIKNVKIHVRLQGLQLLFTFPAHALCSLCRHNETTALHRDHCQMALRCAVVSVLGRCDNGNRERQRTRSIPQHVGGFQHPPHDGYPVQCIQPLPIGLYKPRNGTENE